MARDRFLPRQEPGTPHQLTWERDRFVPDWGREPGLNQPAREAQRQIKRYTVKHPRKKV